MGDAPSGRVRALVFDLDGVLTDTARAHYAAWKEIADAVGAPFDEHANEALKGVDRMGSLDLILQKAPRPFDAAEREALAARKNARYRELIAGFGPGDLLPGARAALERARARGLPTALASASRNAPELLRRLEVAHLFDAVVDPASVPRGKPDPGIFLAAARALHVAPGACLGIEDAQAGVAAIKAAGMTALGVGDPQLLAQADVVTPDLASVDWERLLA
ncbi:MAG: beta-phosphoglucomutase [Caulobacteraceae bacterium]|nr:beta-phosphoglucomutase [Caulobacter sp.]